jgi:hypothetical protein
MKIGESKSRRALERVLCSGLFVEPAERKTLSPMQVIETKKASVEYKKTLKKTFVSHGEYVSDTMCSQNVGCVANCCGGGGGGGGSWELFGPS